MHNAKTNISAQELVHDIIPKLKATEKLVNDTLRDAIRKTNAKEERNQRTLQQQEFELELTMINMNLDHLLKRYAQEIQAVAEDGDKHAVAMLELDQHERFAVESAKKLYEQVKAIQTA